MKGYNHIARHLVNKHSIIILVMMASLLACTEGADQPVYITINQPILNIEASEGTDFHIIEEYYMFHRTSLLGGFSYGNEIPVLAEGMEEVLIFPGVRLNGLINQPDIYFMMEEDTLIRNFEPGQEISYTPTFRYRDNAVFRLIEDFETGTSFSDDIDGNSSSSISIVDNGGYNGTSGGLLRLTPDNPRMEVASLPKIPTINTTSDIIIEVTYKSEIELAVGVYGSTPNFGEERLYKVVLFPTETFNKVYIDVAPEIRGTGYEAYQVLFGVGLDGVTTSGDAIIDDVKLLYLN